MGPNIRTMVGITLGLLALGILLGILSGIPEVINLGGKELISNHQMLMTATEMNFSATNAVVQNTKDYHAWVATTTSMPLQETSSGQNSQMAIVDMQNMATQEAFQTNLQGTKMAEQFVIFKTANANFRVSTAEERNIIRTEDAIQLQSDREKFNFEQTQTQAAGNFQVAQTQVAGNIQSAQTQVVAAKNFEATATVEQDNKDYTKTLMGSGLVLLCCVSVILMVGVGAWVLSTILRRPAGGV